MQPIFRHKNILIKILMTRKIASNILFYDDVYIRKRFRGKDSDFFDSTADNPNKEGHNKQSTSHHLTNSSSALRRVTFNQYLVMQ